MRFRFRYSLKVFLLLWLLIGLGLGWFGIHWQKASRQAAAVKAIGIGELRYNYEDKSFVDWEREMFPDPDSWEYRTWNSQTLKDDSTKWRRLPIPPEPEWLVDSLGVDFFHPITFYHCAVSRCGAGPGYPTLNTSLGKEMDQLPALPGLREVYLWPASIDVPQLMESSLFTHLGNLHELEELTLANMPLTAEHLAPLRDHPKLRKLNLEHAEITDEALAALGTLPALEELYLSDCRSVGKTGLPVIGTWKKLRTVELDHTACDDRFLASLKKLPELEAVNLSHTKISMEAVRELRQLPHLRRLNLCGSHFTDAQLAEVFQGWSNLVTLDLAYTNAGEQFASICPTLTGLKYLNLKETPLAPEAKLAVPIALPQADCKLEIGTPYNGIDPFAVNTDAENATESSDPFAEGFDADSGQEALDPFQ